MGSCDSYTGLDETSWCHISAKITPADTLYSISSATHTCIYSVCVFTSNFLAKEKQRVGKSAILSVFFFKKKNTGYTQKNSEHLSTQAPLSKGGYKQAQ